MQLKRWTKYVRLDWKVSGHHIIDFLKLRYISKRYRERCDPATLSQFDEYLWNANTYWSDEQYCESLNIILTGIREGRTICRWSSLLGKFLLMLILIPLICIIFITGICNGLIHNLPNSVNKYLQKGYLWLLGKLD